MPKTNNIDELRAHLFDTLRSLRDPEKPMELDRARAISQVAGTIIDSARVEVEFARVTGATDPQSAFMQSEPEKLPDGITSITRHRIAG